MARRPRYIATAAFLLIFAIFLIFNLRNSGEYPQTMFVAAMACKVRSGPGHEFDVVAMVSQHEKVIVLGMAEDENHRTWYQIDAKSLTNLSQDADTRECYIRSDLLVINEDNIE